MKRSNKILLITGLATVTIGTAGVLHTNYMQQLEEKNKTIKAYNQSANMLDNVFTQENIKYLPFILERATEEDNITPKTIKKDDVVAAFSQKGLTIKNISTGEKIVTGTKITVQENSDVYNVVIYGDINSDGQVNVLDIQKIIRHVIYMGDHELKGANKIAANLQNSDETINVLDAQRIIKFCIDPVKNKILLNEPLSDKEADKTAPVITLKGQAEITLEQGETYTDEGATAIDNYDGDVTAEVSIKITFVAEGSTSSEVVSQVDTSRIGTYTITYTVSDSNGNTASKERKVIVKAPEIPPAAIDRIEVTTQPNKTTYEYGEATKLDLTGASITIYMDDGSSTTKSITEGMLSTHDLTTAGEKEITVTYQGKVAATPIKITVLKAISELVITNTGMNNVQEVTDGYQTNSKEDFVLGTIQAKQQDDGSTLKQNQLKFEPVSNVTINFEDDGNGNILIKGKAEEAGNYTLKVYIQYGTEKVEKVIQLTVKKSDVVGQVKVIPTEANEVIKVGKVAKRKLTVINVNGEEIEVTSGNIVINEKNGITITKLDKAGNIIGQNDIDAIVDSLQIATTLETEQTVTMDMTVNGKAADFTFNIQAKSVLSSFEIQEDVLNVYAVLPDNETNVIPGTTAETAGNIYTLIKPVFKDQYGNVMDVTANDIFASANADEVNIETQSGKVGILLPKVNVKYPLIPVEVPDLCIDTRYYNGDKLTTGGDEINQIGFSIILNDSNKTVNLAKLAEAKIIIKCGSMEKELPIEVHYKKLTNLSINTSTITLQQDDEGNYSTKINEEFTLGVVTVGAGETPVTVDMLTTEVIGDKSGITISYVANENGDIIVKGRVTKEGVYQIKPKVGDVVGNGIDIRGVSTPIISSIEMEDFELQIGEGAAKKELIVKSDINPTLQPIKTRDITFSQKDATTDQPAEYLDIILRNAAGQSTNATDRPDEIVKSIDIKVKDNVLVAKEAKLIITLFAGEENEYHKEVIISIKQPIPKGIEIGDTITLYDTHIEGTTVQGTDGLVYTLLPVKLFADANNTRRISASSNLFTIIEAEKENKVYIQRPSIAKYIIAGDQQIPAGNQPVLEVKYFDDRKEETSKDIAYVGMAMQAITPSLGYNKSDLNGKTIKFICGDATESAPTAEITINYTGNN